jgi:hypothetical protein
MNYPLLTLTLAALLVSASVPAHAQVVAHHEHEPAATAEAHVFGVTAVDYAIRAPETLPSGWTTLDFTNEGDETHFVFLMRLPEGQTAESYEMAVSSPFAEIDSRLQTGEIDHEGAIGLMMQDLPEWFWQIEFMGGPGYLAPGAASQVTLNLTSGNYVVECYMKTADGSFHAMEGMLRPLTVTEDVSAASAPAADIQITLSNAGIELEGDLTPGTHTVAVHFAEHPEMGFPHDLNIARLDADTEIDAVVGWMNWMNAGGLQPPAPATFVGGIRPMPAGHTGYFTVTLEPGRYLLISEASGYQGVLKEVKISEY